MTPIRHALRQARRQPGFTFIVTAMLAVGIGATTAMFSTFHELLLRELRVPEPEQLVNLGAPGRKWGVPLCGAAGDCEHVFSYAMFRDLEARQTALSELAGHYAFLANLAYGGETQSSQALLVSGDYFATLRVAPLLGRLIGPQDDARIGDGAVAVLSHQYWQNSLGADPGVVGRAMIVNGQTLTIVGVAPERFAGTTAGWNPSVFVPLTMRVRMEANPTWDENRAFYWVYAFGRLKPGVSPEQARASLDTLYSGIINEVEAPLFPTMAPDVLERFRASRLAVEPGARGQSNLQRFLATPLAMLLGVTAVVLLIVCVNVANLMLARGARRAGELAIRSSIGASRRHLVLDLLLEATVLGVLGGLASLPVAFATLRAVVALVPAGTFDRQVLPVTPSSTAGAFAVALTLATVLLFGLLPALRTSRADPGAAMKGAAHNAVSGRGVTRVGGALATSQIVLSMMLLVLAGLFAQSLANLARANLGMNVDSVVTFTVSPRRNGYGNPQAMQFFAALERELASRPGVTSVASSMALVLGPSSWGGAVQIEGRELDGAASAVNLNDVSPSFFRTLSIPLLDGRDFTAADDLGAPPVGIVNEAFVRKFHLENDVIGKRVSLVGLKPDIEIVGVVADAKYSSVRADAPPQLILPRLQNDNIAALSYYVRAAIPADVLMRTIRGVVAAADPNLPVTALSTMDDVVKINTGLDRIVAVLAGGFAALATLLAAIGLYGVLAYNVAQRTRELGLRLALGATAGGLRRMVLRQVAKIALIGVPIGLGIGVLLGQGARTLLYGLSNYDPVVLSGAVAVLAGVVLVAGYLPARRASAVEPMQALRHD
jgi:predicted permease